MKKQEFVLQRYDADDGMVFDWKDLAAHTHTELDEQENEIEIQDHLNAKTIFLSVNDSIDNYVEVEVVENAITD